jgi:hypothetical protein
MMGRYAAMFGREAKGNGNLEFCERLHLPVKPVESIGAKAVRPGQTGSEVAYAKPPHPFHRFAQPVILEMEPLTQPQNACRLGKRVDAELRLTILAQQTHVEMPVVG